MNEQKIYLSSPHMGGEELKFVQEAFETNWVSPVGPHISSFEGELAHYLGSPYAAALSSGTAAIHLALIILGIKSGDEVICSSFTFSGSCNPIAYLQATPVFIDSEPDTWNMDPDLLEMAILDRIKIGKKPKAIILVHLYGMPAKVDRILKIASHFEIPIIEDAAEALGSSYSGKMVGTFGELGVFSFNGNKIITTAGGGALVSRSKKHVEKARFLATQAREPFPHYEHTEIGYNYRLSNVSAGIGRGQLQVLDNHVAARRRNHSQYAELFAQTPWIKLLQEPDGAFSNRWLSCILIQNTDNENINSLSLRVFLDSKNIESRPLWKPMHLQPVFEGFPSYSNGVSEQLFKEGLCLPSGSNLTKADFDRITIAIKDWLVTVS
jgi:dTDP-4-amino-4,6-dideoxygalactose transaminase